MNWPKAGRHTQTTFGGLRRSALMSRIRSTGNTTTELRLVKYFRVAGVRGWRRNYPLPGNPDFVFPRARVVVFVDGCFWHGHNCGRNLSPRTNAAAWQQKIFKTRERDRRSNRRLTSLRWQVIRLSECALAKEPSACAAKIKRILNIRNRTAKMDKKEAGRITTYG